MLRGLLIPGRCAERRHHQGPVGISSAATVEAEPAAYLTRIRFEPSEARYLVGRAQRPIVPGREPNEYDLGRSSIIPKTDRMGLITRRCRALRSTRDLGDGPAGDLVGVTRQVVERLLADRTRRSSICRQQAPPLQGR